MSGGYVFPWRWKPLSPRVAFVSRSKLSECLGRRGLADQGARRSPWLRVRHQRAQLEPFKGRRLGSSVTCCHCISLARAPLCVEFAGARHPCGSCEARFPACLARRCGKLASPTRTQQATSAPARHTHASPLTEVVSAKLQFLYSLRRLAARPVNAPTPHAALLSAPSVAQ